jgi:hypothetical protein
MALLSYNRYLAWVVVPAILWALLACMSLMAPGPGREPRDGRLKAGMRFEPVPEALEIEGVLLSAREDQQRLYLQIAGSPSQREEQPAIPSDISIEYVPGDPGAPQQFNLELQDGMAKPRRLPGGDFGFATKHYVIKYGGKEIEILPRPKWMRPMGEPGMRPEDRPGKFLRRFEELRERRQGAGGEPQEREDQRSRDERKGQRQRESGDKQGTSKNEDSAKRREAPGGQGAG